MAACPSWLLMLCPLLALGAAQLEAVNGEPDPEARAALAKLTGATAAASAAASGTAQVDRIAAMSETELAAQLGNIEHQLDQVQALLASADDQTKGLVAQHVAVWSGKDDPPTSDQGTASTQRAE